MSKRMQRAVSGAPRSCGRACGRHGGAAAATPPSPHATDPLSSYPPSLASPTSACSCAGTAPVAARHLSARPRPQRPHARARTVARPRGTKKRRVRTLSPGRDSNPKPAVWQLRLHASCLYQLACECCSPGGAPRAGMGWGGVGMGMGKAKRRGATSRGRRAQQARAGRRAAVRSGPFSPCTPALAPREDAARRAREAVARPLAPRAAKDGRRQR